MDIFFDTGHDATLLNTDLRFTETDDEVKQRITIALQFLYGEWFLSTSVGIPYTQTIFELNADELNVASAIIRKALKNIEGVETIDELDLSLDRDARKLTVSIVVNQTVSVEVII